MQNDPLLPVIRNTTLDLAYNLFKPDWPVIFANANATLQNSADEPDHLDTIKNLTHTLTGGFALVREKWTLAPTYSFTRFEDDSIADSDSQTHQASLMLGLQPRERLSLNPSLAWSQTDSGQLAPTTRIFQGTLSGTWYFNPKHDLFLTLSAMDLDTDDNSSHTATVDNILQYNWHPEPPFLRQARKTVSLRGRYYNQEDRIGEDSEEDYSIFLSISIGGLPLDLF
jgi:predicted porin